jgi:acetolactate synthase-1/2/3 large subunit
MVSISTVSKILVDSFENLGITDAFVVTGGAISAFTEALAKSTRIKNHYLLNEQSASIAAEAYGHYDGKPALLVVTSGPGVTNTLTGISAAWTNSSPLIVISGQARSVDVLEASSGSNRQVGNQHLNTSSFVKSITKYFLEPTSEFDVGSIAQEMYETAISGRMGPVWLSLPSDIQRLPIEGVDTNFSGYNIPNENSKSSIDFLKAIRDLFSESKAPAILLGNGSRVEGKLPVEISEFIEEYSIPVLTTWPGMDLVPYSHPLFFGRPGTISSGYVANLIIQKCDALLILGARLDLAQVGFRPNEFAIRAKVLRIDVDKNEFLRIPKRLNWINLEVSIENFLPSIKQANIESSGNELWLEQIRSWNNVPHERAVSNFEDGLSTYRVIQRLSETGISVIACGSSGTCVEMVLQTWKIEQNQRFIFSCGLGSMGFGLASAIGLSIKTKQKILLIESDGSFAMNIQDLETIASLRLDIKIFILNSGGYKSIKLSQQRQGQFAHGTDERTGVFLPKPVKWAKAAGIVAFDIQKEEDLVKLIDEEIHDDIPKLFDIHVSPTEEAIPRLISRVQSGGLMQTAAFDDLWPNN